jgi:sugar phosphate isomerase/epimerase
MKTIKGPGVFLAQFADDKAPFNSIEGLAGWAAGKGFKGAQIPTWDTRVIDLKRAAESQTYCDDYAGKLAERGLVVTELASHLQGQLVALIRLTTIRPTLLRLRKRAGTQWRDRDGRSSNFTSPRAPRGAWASTGMSRFRARCCGHISIRIRNGRTA